MKKIFFSYITVTILVLAGLFAQAQTSSKDDPNLRKESEGRASTEATVGVVGNSQDCPECVLRNLVPGRASDKPKSLSVIPEGKVAPKDEGAEQ